MPKTSLQLILIQVAILLCCSATPAQNISGKIVYADDPGRIQVINADGTGQTKLTAGGSILDDNPVYSPNGSKIAFTRFSGSKIEICVMNADGTNVVQVTSGDVTPESFNGPPSWSPDGTKFVFGSNRSGFRKGEIWRANADGSGLIRLTTSVQLGSDGEGPLFSSDGDADWSPDGSKIAFVSNRDGADTELYVIDVDGSNPVRLTNDGLDDLQPDWSPDSQRIAFTKSNGNGIHIINRDGTNLVSIITFSSWPAWSPDGTKLAFVQLDSANNDRGTVFISNTDGTNKIKVTNNPDGARAPSWAPSSSSPIPTFTISGQVKDTNGAAVSGATLTIFQIPIRTTQSDSSGSYSFTGLPTGTYKVDISGEARAAIEFDLGNTNPNRIQRAILKITSEGTGVLPGTLTVPVQVNGYLGDGTLETDLFNTGTFITVFDTFATPDHVPQFIDVTEFLQGIRPSSQRVVGFILKTSTPVSINYGSLEEGSAPTLLITLK